MKNYKFELYFCYTKALILLYIFDNINGIVYFCSKPQTMLIQPILA